MSAWILRLNTTCLHLPAQNFPEQHVPQQHQGISVQRTFYCTMSNPNSTYMDRWAMRRQVFPGGCEHCKSRRQEHDRMKCVISGWSWGHLCVRLSPERAHSRETPIRAFRKRANRFTRTGHPNQSLRTITYCYLPNLHVLQQEKV